jgi:hypothetical protein
VIINFDAIEADSQLLAGRFRAAAPFEHVVIDNFCDASQLMQLVEEMPDPSGGKIGRSRDYVFARNKFEKSQFKEVSPRFAALYDDFTCDRFAQILRQITGEKVFVDPDFHGGGMHQGGEGSFLDMHVDFNTHPLHADWFRNLNILLYLNRDWRPEYGGELKIRHRDNAGLNFKIEPVFNRCVVMFTRDYTVHGYDEISFPAGQYRRSIAAYAYSPLEERAVQHRTTVWYPENSGVMKRSLGRAWPYLVKVKNSIFGSSTTKNR